MNNFNRYKDVKSLLIWGERHYDAALTFVIPTYKRIDGLQKAIDSIVNQETTINYEIIVVDNEKVDIEKNGQKEMLKSFTNKKIAYYQNERNIGLFGNWNRCIELSNTKWVAMLHDDDELADDYFEKLEKFWKILSPKKNVLYVKARSTSFCGGIKQNRYLVEYKKRDLELLGPNQIGILGAPTCGTLINKDLFIERGGYNEDNYPSEDALFIFRALKETNYHVYRTVENMGKILHDDSVSFKPETLIKYAYQYTNLMEDYHKWGKISRWMSRWIKHGMFYAEREQILKLIVFEDDEKRYAFVNELDEILKQPRKNVQYYIYLIIKNFALLSKFI